MSSYFKYYFDVLFFVVVVAIDLFSLAPEQPASPGNPFARPPDFDPFADSFDPLGMKPNQANNQMQDLQVLTLLLNELSQMYKISSKINLSNSQ